VIDWLASGGMFLLVDQWSKKMAESQVADRSVSWRFLRIRRVRTLRNIVYEDGMSAPPYTVDKASDANGNYTYGDYGTV